MKVTENYSNRRMNKADFGVTFFTSSQRQDICGTNGLPLTPSSIRILGRAQLLKTFSHRNLAEYVEIIRGKHERIIVVLEYYPTNLRSLIKTGPVDQARILSIGKGILSGLSYLNRRGIVCRTLGLDTILLDEFDCCKIFHYGLNYMTNNGKYVAFPVGNPKYTAPEVFLASASKTYSLYSCDSWSLGLILTELLLGAELWSDLKLPQIIRKVASLRNNCDNGILQRVLQEHKSEVNVKDLDDQLRILLEKCLELDPSQRPSPTDLLQQISSSTSRIGIDGDISQHYSKFLRCLQLNPNDFNDGVSKSVDESATGDSAVCSVKSHDYISQRSLKEVYYLWQLAGGDVFAELKRQGLTRKKPAVLSLACSMTLEGESHGKAKERGLLLDNTIIILPLNELRKRLKDVPAEDYFPLIVGKSPFPTAEVMEQSKQLPLVIREKDIEYQFHRILLFDRLIKGYPYTKAQICREAFIDIPPFFRAQIWSCLLDLEGDLDSRYNGIDKETPTSTDRQIEVDIPRCHQYDELLSSPAGHEKFKRVLKAWVVSNTEYVYWQGLDSLCAPFLYLHFNNEALAHASLSAFIPKYLFNFFLKDNSMVIQEYLAKFSQLIAFHDPPLTNHLDSIGFIPELYAIPWFLTMFSHVFPLHKIFHLWDKLLLGDSSFPLCIGLSILYQLRDSLLMSGFNECILLFSDMPEINIEQCVEDSVKIYRSTPKSVFCRKHEPPVKPKMCYEFTGQYDGPKNIHECLTKVTGLRSSNANVDDLIMEAIPLNNLKQEKCPRISGEDFLYFLDVNNSQSKMIVVDVRNHEDYNRGSVPSSINLPFTTSFTPEGALVLNTEATFLSSNKGKIIAVVGNRGDSAIKFAEALLRLEYPRVCVLHRGIDILRSCNVLKVPSVM